MTHEEQDRRARLTAMNDAGIEAYPAESNRTHTLAQVKERFSELEQSGQPVTVTGRVMARRTIGALAFLRLQDESSQLQVVMRSADLGDAYKTTLDLLDVGDFLEVVGTAFVTKTGEQSILSASIRFLAKSLKPLPEKWHGLQDVETRYRQRELDLLSNVEIRNRFITRSRLVSRMRHFLDERGFLEVETPMLQPIPGGANARPFITHHNALDADLYLRIAPELYLKRLLVGGFEKIYEIGRCFRNEGIDYSHNPEFTMLELYWAYAKKDEFVDFLEAFVTDAIQHAFGALEVPYGEGTLSFASPWPRTTFCDAIKRACGIDIDTLKTSEEVVAAAREKKLNIDFSSCVGLGEHLDELFKKTARAAMKSPTWVFEYPLALKPLTKASPTDPTKSSAVQLVVEGAEIINAYYYELNDPLDQRARFEEQQALRDAGSEDAQWLDEAFLSALETGMPPASGVGIGIDRLVAFLTNAPNLKEVILFPTLKPEQGGEDR